jgi:hypothetical protein
MIVGVAILLFYSATWRAEKKEKQAARADLFGLIPDLDPCLPRLYYCGEKISIGTARCDCSHGGLVHRLR